MFYRKSIPRRSALAMVAATGAGILAGCVKADRSREDLSSAVEILASQHGVLYRTISLLEEFRGGLDARMDLPPEILGGTIELIRLFAINYHQQLEEKHIYPVFRAAVEMSGLMSTLRDQHEAGSRLIEVMRKLCAGFSPKDMEKRRTLGAAIHSFGRMYRAHAEREDTILFPQLRRLIPPKSYADLGFTFQRAETEFLGQSGFEDTIRKIGMYENLLGIEDLASFTPHAEDFQ